MNKNGTKKTALAPMICQPMHALAMALPPAMLWPIDWVRNSSSSQWRKRRNPGQWGSPLTCLAHAWTASLKISRNTQVPTSRTTFNSTCHKQKGLFSPWLELGKNNSEEGGTHRSEKLVQSSVVTGVPQSVVLEHGKRWNLQV